jgi:polyisoprenoid-binding protein YceI
MKFSSLFRSTVVAASLLSVSLAATAEDWSRYEAQPGSKVTIAGTSTVHDWTVEGRLIGGFMEVNKDFSLENAKDVKVNPKVEAIIPVRSIKSGKKRMDEVMHEAMKEKEHPQIKYRLIELKPKSGATGAQFDAVGALTVAGVTRTNTMPVTMEKAGDDKLKVTGSTALKMTEFGIKPPAPEIALGLIKTGDDVKINFEWVTAKKK